MSDEPTPCACSPRCRNAATITPYSPYMNDYCDDCTYLRCDVSFDVHDRAVTQPTQPEA